LHAQDRLWASRLQSLPLNRSTCLYRSRRSPASVRGLKGYTTDLHHIFHISSNKNTAQNFLRPALPPSPRPPPSRALPNIEPHSLRRWKSVPTKLGDDSTVHKNSLQESRPTSVPSATSQPIHMTVTLWAGGRAGRMVFHNGDSIRQDTATPGHAKKQSCQACRSAMVGGGIRHGQAHDTCENSRLPSQPAHSHPPVLSFPCLMGRPWCTASPASSAPAPKSSGDFPRHPSASRHRQRLLLRRSSTRAPPPQPAELLR
jgi:hypothetical protein